METRSSATVKISDSIGEISTLTILPKRAKAILLIAHGAGAGMKHPFLESLAALLAEVGIGTVRYNFPYMENKKKRPDVPAVAEKTVAVMISQVFNEYKGIPIFVGGKSFGGRMTSQKLSKECPEDVKGIIFFGFPLHAIGNPGVDRANHLSTVNRPMLFLQGTKDKLAEVDLIKEVCSNLPTSTLQFFEGADHSFAIGKKVMLPQLVDAASRWIDKILSTK